MIASLLTRGSTIICIHVRLTDRSGQSPPIEWYLEWLNKLWLSLDNPVLYIASDDLIAAVAAFEKFQPVTLNEITQSIAGLEWLQDFYVIMNSDIVASSSGGFCTLANMLNTTLGGQFYRPNFDKNCLMKYSPLSDSEY